MKLWKSAFDLRVHLTCYCGTCLWATCALSNATKPYFHFFHSNWKFPEGISHSPNVPSYRRFTSKVAFWVVAHFICGTIHKGRLQKILVYFTPSLPPFPHFDQTYSSKFRQPPLLCLLLGYPLPLAVDILYEWSPSITSSRPHALYLPEGWGRSIRDIDLTDDWPDNLPEWLVRLSIDHSKKTSIETHWWQCQLCGKV